MVSLIVCKTKTLVDLCDVAFDSGGRHYDQVGKYTDWWDNTTVNAFEERAQCFVDQYDKFTVTGPNDKVLHVNGRLTLGENIADAGGLTAAFHAWKKHDEAKADLRLPGLESFTKEQLFFISYGSWWCGKTTKEAAEQAIYNDPHAPKSARNIVSLFFRVRVFPSTDYYHRKPWPTLGSSKMPSVALRRSLLVSFGDLNSQGRLWEFSTIPHITRHTYMQSFTPLSF